MATPEQPAVPAATPFKAPRRAAILVLVGLLFWLVPSAAMATTGPSRQTSTRRLDGAVLPDLSDATDLGRLDPNQNIVVAVTVKHDLAALYKAEAALYDPASPTYQQFLEPDEWRAQFNTAPAQLAAIRDFATSQGMTLVNPDVLGDYVMTFGTVAQAEQTYGVELHQFRNAETTFFANTAAPTVPADLAIDSVLGLESLDAYHLAALDATAPTGTQPQCVPDPAATGGQACTGIMQPKDLWTAYDQPSNNLGQGQTIAIIGEGQSADVIAALREFEKTRGLPKVPVQVYRTDPADKNVPEAQRDDAGRIEWELDTQASTGMAPDVSQVRLYFGSSLALTQLTGAFSTWVNDPAGPLQASASLGACESNPALSPLFSAAQRQDAVLLAQAAMEGRTLFASTGDTGYGCSVAVSENGIQYGPIPTDEYPAVDPNTVAVGGTILYTDGSGHRVLERAWDHTGGGPSKFVAQPPYQTGASPLLASNACATQDDGTPFPPGQLCRGVSDVAALSGDITISVEHRINDLGVPSPVSANGYDMVDYCPAGEAGAPTDPVLPSCAYGAAPGTMTDHFSEGGTSLSSPLWLGMWARVQASHDAVNPTTLRPVAKQSLGFANTLIYKLAQGAKTARDFVDVTVGANPLPAGPGWDFPTGWGTPDISALIQDANGRTSTKPVSTVMPHGSDPATIYATPASAPSCAYAFVDPSGDAPDSLTLSEDDQLDLLQGDFGLTSDGHHLRVAMTINNLSKAIPTGSTFLDYEFWWNYKPAGASTATVYAVDVQVDTSGTVTYTDGTMTVTDAGGTTNYQFTPNPSSTATGTFGSGLKGRVEVDVPLSEVGSPPSGAALQGAQAFTADGTTPALGFIVDQAGPGKDYKVGQTTCLR